MKLGTKSRYAVMAMTDIAMNSGEEKPVNITSISLRNNLPISYLEQIFVKLRRGNLVQSNRGSSGGYTLSRPAKEISICDIITAVEGKVTTTGCGNKSQLNKNSKNNNSTTLSCRGNGVKCLNHHMWIDLEKKINNYLNTISLNDIIIGYNKNNSNINSNINSGISSNISSNNNSKEDNKKHENIL